MSSPMKSATPKQDEKDLSRQVLAAAAFSKMLETAGIRHALIGGVAVQALGHMRPTEDVDVLVEFKADKIRDRVMALISGDLRFELIHHRLYFVAGQGDPVLIETLPCGTLNLPRRIQPVKLDKSPLLVLRPGILVLTKIKRAVHLLESDRPATKLKLRNDILDIKYLLQVLIDAGQTMEFGEYDSIYVGRLYEATATLRKAAIEKDENMVPSIDKCLKPADLKRIMG